ncbi:MAG: polysaccharide deacetylase family protein [Azoarcus sp.]|jgi:peptidoglycan/xylan/chitin deacetylase (PgdA/CDA1 family)|nr:polysaccharide deacetylase family protein [Azoarcus sp.]
MLVELIIVLCHNITYITPRCFLPGESKAVDALEVEAEIKTLGGIFGKNAVNMFRPPYGQRSAEVLDVFKASGTKTILWNIDTQDWSRKITAPEVKDRLISLMLFWRSGIILFHDVHPKAAEILPDVFKAFGPDIVSFTDRFPAASSPGLSE